MQKCVFLYFSHITCRNEVKSFACDCNQGFGNFISGVGNINIGAMKKFDIGQNNSVSTIFLNARMFWYQWVLTWINEWLWYQHNLHQYSWHVSKYNFNVQTHPFRLGYRKTIFFSYTCECKDGYEGDPYAGCTGIFLAS